MRCTNRFRAPECAYPLVEAAEVHRLVFIVFALLELVSALAEVEAVEDWTEVRAVGEGGTTPAMFACSVVDSSITTSFYAALLARTVCACWRSLSRRENCVEQWQVKGRSVVCFLGKEGSQYV